MKKQLSFIGAVLVFALPTLALAAQQQVTLGANSISPSTLDINAGDTVVWTNTSGTTQSVTGNNNLFQSGAIAPGGQFAATFNTSGTYNYYDDAGGSAVVGQIIVSGTSASASASSPTTTAYNPNANYYTSSSAASTNPTVASLQSEVQALIAEINSIEGNAGASTGVSGTPTYTGVGSCPQIGRVLSLGTSGSDVTSLQQFLGVSPATGYFGTLTQAAVEQYQAENNIISYGTPATTGYGVVGPRTAAAIRLACGSGTSTGASTGAGTGVVSGFLQVAPISGDAPLTITATVTVNTAGSCSGSTYTLDYGDGSQDQVITVPSGNCAQQNQTFQHTYQNGGTFTVTLSAGSHSSTATVTVSGQPASTSVTSSGNPEEASGSMNAFVTSGPAPLATTFYVSCASGLAYDVVFGDGSDLGSSGVSQSTCNGGLQSVAHTYASPGSYNAQLVVFVRNSQGTISSQGVAEQGITVTDPSSGPSSSGSGSGSYQPPTLTPDVGGNPLAVSLSYNYDSDGCEVSIDWGDGSSLSPTGCSTFSGKQQTFTQNHTYSGAGDFTITLRRASQTNSVSVSISN